MRAKFVANCQRSTKTHLFIFCRSERRRNVLSENSGIRVSKKTRRVSLAFLVGSCLSCRCKDSLGGGNQWHNMAEVCPFRFRGGW